MTSSEQPFARRSFLGAAVVLPITAVLAGDSGRKPVVSRDLSATVDLGHVVQATTPHAIGVGVSTYGANALDDHDQRDAENRLDGRFVRLPVGWRNERVTSSAVGGSTTLDMTALADMYRSWGYRVIAVIGGRTNDVDVRPGDAENIIRALGNDMIDYSSPNEPDNAPSGSLASAIDTADMIHAEGTRLFPDLVLWGPVWTTYDRVACRTFAEAMGAHRLGGVDYHHYAMGQGSLSTAAALEMTPAWGREVSEVRSDLRFLGLPERVNVDEYNLSWRSDDGTSEADGGFVSPASNRRINGRFFTAVNTVFTASVAGHIMRAGGFAMPYATQNRALGVMVQNEYDGNTADHPESRGVLRPESSPMPAYWGIAAWTGGKIWPHMKDAFYDVVGPVDPLVEVFAVNNEAGGHNVVIINKAATRSVSLSLTFRGVPDRPYDLFQSTPEAPYDPPRRIVQGETVLSGVVLSVPALTVSVLVLKQGGG